jgi:hypothetical protein
MLLSINMVFAVGIKWYTEEESVEESSEKCIRYGAYNPSSNDIIVKVDVTKTLRVIVMDGSTGDKLVKARTSSSEAEDVNFCFKVATVYEPDCLIGNLLCEQTCEEDTKSYSGELVMTEVPINQGGGTGSAATVSAAAPLKINVSCSISKREWGPVYITTIILILCIIGALLYKKYRTPKLERDKNKLRKLQQKIKSEERKK